MEFEVGVHDGAHKGRLHSQFPFIGPKTLTALQRPRKIFMGIVEHRWNICLPAFGLGGLCVIFGSSPMRIFVVCAMCTCASREVGGHGKVELLFGAVQKHPLTDLFMSQIEQPSTWLIAQASARAAAAMSIGQWRKSPISVSERSDLVFTKGRSSTPRKDRENGVSVPFFSHFPPIFVITEIPWNSHAIHYSGTFWNSHTNGG